MRVVYAWLLLAALILVPVSAQKRPAPKSKAKQREVPEIGLLKFDVHREPGVVAVEGRLRNDSLKPLRGIIIFFEFLEADKVMISRKSTIASEDSVGPGEECEFVAQTPDPPRSISVRLAAEDIQGKILLVDKPGPYVIQ